jgi:hypothetical protein
MDASVTVSNGGYGGLRPPTRGKSGPGNRHRVDGNMTAGCYWIARMNLYISPWQVVW